jgi:hypothetical protein
MLSTMRRTFSCLDTQVSQFFKAAQHSAPNTPQLAQFMRESLLAQQLTLKDYTNYAPIIDELVLYSKLASEAATLDQALTLVQFGQSYNI